MHRAMKTCGGTHLSSICLPHLHQVVIQSRFCLSPCSCSHSYPLFTSLYLSLFYVSRPQSSSQKSSQRSHGNQSPLFGSAERVHECLTNIPPQKCHLSASERGGRQCLKSWPRKDLGITPLLVRCWVRGQYAQIGGDFDYRLDQIGRLRINVWIPPLHKALQTLTTSSSSMAQGIMSK